MYNVVTKSGLIAAAICTVSMFCSCGRDVNAEADALYGQSSENLSNGNYELALELLDSIDHAYPQAVEIRRKSMQLRPQIIEKYSLYELSKADSILAVQLLRGDSLIHRLEYVNNPVEGYYVAKSAKGTDLSSKSGIYARMAPDGRFYLISSSLKPVKSTSIALSANGDEARTATIAADGERNDRSSGAEIITFIQGECDTIGRFVLSHRDMPITLTFYGRETYSIPLSSEQYNALLEVYETSVAITECKLAQLNKARLEKQLTVARNQMARTYNNAGQPDGQEE